MHTYARDTDLKWQILAHTRQLKLLLDERPEMFASPNALGLIGIMNHLTGMLLRLARLEDHVDTRTELLELVDKHSLVVQDALLTWLTHAEKQTADCNCEHAEATRMKIARWRAALIQGDASVLEEVFPSEGGN